MTVYTNATGATMQYTTNKYEAGDYVLVYLKNNAIIKVEAAETVYGTLTQTGESAGATVSLYMDGTAIPVANASMATKAGDTTVAAADYTTAMNKKATVVLENGYAVAFIGDAAKADISKYVYLAKAVNASTGAISDEYGTVYYPAQVVYMDGTTGIVKLASNADVAVGFYKLGTSGSYKTLDAVATTPDYEVAANFYAKDTTTAEFEMKATSKSLALTGNTKAYITPNTKILFVSGTNANLKVEVATGAMATTLAANTKVLVSEVSKAADAAKEVDVIVVPAAMTTNVDDLYYVVAKDLGDVYVAADTADHIKDQVAVYNVKTGEKKVVMVDDIATVVTGFSTYTVDANGVYDFTLKTGAAYAAFDKNADIKLYGNLLSVDSAIVDADAAEAVIIDITGKGLVKTLTALNEKDATVEFATVRNTTTNKITAIVVTAY